MQNGWQIATELCDHFLRHKVTQGQAGGHGGTCSQPGGARDNAAGRNGDSSMSLPIDSKKGAVSTRERYKWDDKRPNSHS
jgi:hypothetical protein